MPPPLPYPAQQVHKYDHDRYLLSLFAPAERREDLLTLFAFNLELSHIREQVSEPLLGQMRLQWWRDSLAEIYASNKVPAHEILRPLAELITRYHLPAALLEEMVDAREFDLDENPPKTLDDFYALTLKTSAPLAKLAAPILGASFSDGVTIVSAAEVYAIVGQLRSISYMARQRRLYLPQDLLHKYAVLPTRLFELKRLPALNDLVHEIGMSVQNKIKAAKAMRRTIMPKERKRLAPLLLYADLAQLHLKVIRRYGYNVLAPRVGLRHPLDLLYLMGKNLAL